MRKYFLRTTTAMFLVCLMVINNNCSPDLKESVNQRDNSVSSKTETPLGRTTVSRNVMAYELNAIDPIALEYVDNAKTLLYTTDAFAKPSTQVMSYDNFDDASQFLKQNPMSVRLQLLDIVDEETGEPVDFYDLPQDQKEVFADRLLQEDAKNISEKLKLAPEIALILEMENRATRKLIQEKQISPFYVGNLDNWEEEKKPRYPRKIYGVPALRSVEKEARSVKTVDYQVFLLS